MRVNLIGETKRYRVKFERSFLQVPMGAGTGPLSIRGVVWLRFWDVGHKDVAESLFAALGVKYSLASDVVMGIFDFEPWREVLEPWYDIEDEGGGIE